MTPEFAAQPDTCPECDSPVVKGECVRANCNYSVDDEE